MPTWEQLQPSYNQQDLKEAIFTFVTSARVQLSTADNQLRFCLTLNKRMQTLQFLPNYDLVIE